MIYLLDNLSYVQGIPTVKLKRYSVWDMRLKRNRTAEGFSLTTSIAFR